MNITRRHLRNLEIEHHRNGVTGEPFYLCRFRYQDDNALIPMQAVVFDEPGCVAVTTSFIDQHWRGDYFEPALRRAIAAFQQEEMKS